MSGAIRVMLVDDSAIVRGLITRALGGDSDIEIVATAFNGSVAIPLARQLQPDIIVLDIEMPDMDGMTALPQLLEAAPKVKIIMASTLTLRNADISLKALQLGASDYVAKPSARGSKELEEFYRDLRDKIRVYGAGGNGRPASSAPAHTPLPTPAAPKPSVALLPPHAERIKALAIASSTGGPQALNVLFAGLKGHIRTIPIFITQHMPPTFTTILAQHLAKLGERPCKECSDGDIVTPGQTYVAPGDFHMTVEKRDSTISLRLNQSPAENFCRPAADPMLRSLSKAYGQELLVVILTGMGSDGLEGARMVVKNGGQVIAQDEASSVVWGMPGAVATNGLCRAVLPLAEIAPHLIRIISHAP